jgi:hypothetical protein
MLSISGSGPHKLTLQTVSFHTFHVRGCVHNRDYNLTNLGKTQLVSCFLRIQFLISLTPRPPEKLLSGFRYNQNMVTICKYIKPDNVEQWARDRRLDDGGSMLASAMIQPEPEDRRDATCVRVHIFLIHIVKC